MTVVSNDPEWWPTISSFRGASYFQGSWRADSLTQKFDCGFAVAALIAVVYDWGAQDDTKYLLTGLLMSILYSSVLTFGQEVG
jgi:hypothetical protein